MKKSIRHYLVLILAFASCSVYDCSKAEGRLGFIGFASGESDSIIVSVFNRDTNFQGLVDSTTITPANSGYVTSGDTLTLGYGISTTLIKSDYDYEFYFPKIDKRYRLTKITEKQESRNWDLSCNKVGCVNSLINYEQDGQFVDASGRQNMIYVRK
ncbi:MAG: hypothetical protein EOP04_15500 [Proteobacteria bacterium]|nr:MAG: hypothetical protein EOP04_15500 [Pseudomonadota bacterium]